MLYKNILSLLLFIPFFGMTQDSSEWSLYLGKTKLLSASVDSLAHVQLSGSSKESLEFDFSNRDTSFKRSLIVMNEKRNTLLRKEMKPACKKMALGVAELYAVAGGKPVTVYVVDIPSDPSQAALVRVAPVPICYIEWK